MVSGENTAIVIHRNTWNLANSINSQLYGNLMIKPIIRAIFWELSFVVFDKRGGGSELFYFLKIIRITICF